MRNITTDSVWEASSIWNGTFSAMTTPSGELNQTIGKNLSQLVTEANGKVVTTLEQHCLTYRLWTEGVLVVLLLVVGLSGNTLSMLVLWKDRATSASAYLLICLALVDDTVIVVFSILKTIPAFCNINHCASTQYFYAYIQTYGFPLGHMCHMCSTYMIVLVSLQRYLAVCKPHIATKYRSVRAGR